jgi:beta-alanine degradation protein BauB
MFKTIYKQVVAFAIFLSPIVAFSADYQAAHIASPEQYEMIFDNDHVLVVRMVLDAGEADFVHQHNDETVYFQKGGTLRIAEMGGETFEVTVPDGHVMWHPAWTHQVTNIGNTQVVAIIVEEKLQNSGE